MMKLSEEEEAFKKRKYYEFVEYTLNMLEPEERDRRIETHAAERIGIVPFEFGFEAGILAAKKLNRIGNDWNKY